MIHITRTELEQYIQAHTHIEIGWTKLGSEEYSPLVYNPQDLKATIDDSGEIRIKIPSL